MLSIEDRIAVVKNGIRQIEVSIYDMTISAQVANKIGNTQGIDKMQKQMEISTKSLNEYQTILGGLEKEVAAIETPKPSEGA